MKNWKWILAVVVFLLLLLAGTLVEVAHLHKHELRMLPLAQSSFIRSTSANKRSTVVFRNKTSRTISLFWIGYDGNRVLYGVILPHSSFIQSTFATHPWVCVDNNSNDVALFRALPGKWIANITGH